MSQPSAFQNRRLDPSFRRRVAARSGIVHFPATSRSKRGLPRRFLGLLGGYAIARTLGKQGNFRSISASRTTNPCEQEGARLALVTDDRSVRARRVEPHHLDIAEDFPVLVLASAS
jgi:hypothetical protein